MNPPDDRIDSLIDGLVASARPVHRLWPPAVRLVAWLGVLLAVVGASVIAGLRAGAASRLASPVFAAELVCLGAATIAGALLALRGSVPGLDGGPARRALIVALVAGGALGAVDTRLSLATPLASFIDAGIPCAVSSVVIALVPWVTMLWAIGRGMPLRSAPTCAAGGLAASVATYALMRVRCPLDETLHVAVWHGLPVVLATVAAAALGALLVRARRIGGSSV